MRKDYIARVKRFSNEYMQDVLKLVKKYQPKAYPTRIRKTLLKKYKNLYKYKVTLALTYMEYLGVLTCKLESRR